jgi:intracellular septation protein A
LVFAMAGALIGSSIAKKPFLVALAKKQRPDLPEIALQRLGGLNLRMGLFMIVVGLLGVYAAFYWPTAWWAAFKAIGAPILMIVYMLIDLAIVGHRARRGPR